MKNTELLGLSKIAFIPSQHWNTGLPGAFSRSQSMPSTAAPAVDLKSKSIIQPPKPPTPPQPPKPAAPAKPAKPQTGQIKLKL